MVRKLVLAFTGLGVASAVAICLLTIPLLRRLPNLDTPGRALQAEGSLLRPTEGE
jgi:hypothetical protein